MDASCAVSQLREAASRVKACPRDRAGRALRRQGRWHAVQVLHKFLEVFSCFDWDRYCLSLRGPIALDSFPNPVGAPGITYITLCTPKSCLATAATQNADTRMSACYGKHADMFASEELC